MLFQHSELLNLPAAVLKAKAGPILYIHQGRSTKSARPLQESEQSIEEPLQELLEGRVRSVEYSGGQVIVDAPRRGRVYLPGSFNPLHDGHK